MAWGATDSLAALDDPAATERDTQVTIDVLENDNDQDGDPLTIVSVSLPDFGMATHDGSTVSYTRLTWASAAWTVLITKSVMAKVALGVFLRILYGYCFPNGYDYLRTGPLKGPHQEGKIAIH